MPVPKKKRITSRTSFQRQNHLPPAARAARISSAPAGPGSERGADGLGTGDA